MPRHPKHDYRSPCIYHITLKKLISVPDFSVIAGTPDSCYPGLYPVGQAVESCICTISDLNPYLKMLQYIVMPDHVHMLIHVLEYLDRPLGVYIGKFKVECMKRATFRGVFDGPVFERDFHDRFLRRYHSLDVIFSYIRENPRRLLVRRLYPYYFRRCENLFEYKGIRWQCYGNMQLLDNPFKDAVICHRKDAMTPGLEESKRDNWLHTASNGGVLVSAFISGKEKEIRKMAEEAEGKIILLVNEPFGERYKPGGHNFELCEQGRLLILAPDIVIPDSRQGFLFLNELALQICSPRG